MTAESSGGTEPGAGQGAPGQAELCEMEAAEAQDFFSENYR